MKTTILILTMFTGAAFANTKLPSRSTASVHAKELLGKRYKKSIVSQDMTEEDITNKIHSIVENGLPKAYKSRALSVSKAIIEESAKYALDPFFVLAVISGESSFNPLAVGPVGEIGMMQIRPSTGKWMAEIIKSKWGGEKTLRDPVTNIKLGVAYLSWLRAKFDGHSQLYLAAYNMGPKAVKNAVSKAIYPKDYPIHVMKRYIAFYKEIGKPNTL
jgi:soluble lytic murein transglycosylase